MSLIYEKGFTALTPGALAQATELVTVFQKQAEPSGCLDKLTKETAALAQKISKLVEQSKKSVGWAEHANVVGNAFRGNFGRSRFKVPVHTVSDSSSGGQGGEGKFLLALTLCAPHPFSYKDLMVCSQIVPLLLCTARRMKQSWERHPLLMSLACLKKCNCLPYIFFVLIFT